MNRIRAAAALTSAVAIAGVGVVTTASAQPTASASRAHTVSVMSTNIGKILYGPSGLPLYLFTHDKRNKDTCVTISSCTGVWPLLTTSGMPTAGPGVKPSLLGTIKVGHRTQVTYAGHPLYNYAQSNGSPGTGYVGTAEFGGAWDAVSPSGKAVR